MTDTNVCPACGASGNHDHEAADLTNGDLELAFGCTRMTVYNRRESQNLPYVQLGDNIRYRKSEVLLWAEENKIEINEALL